MKTNVFARIWYSSILRGSRKFADCPETVKGYEVKSVVGVMLRTYGHEDLITVD